MYYSPPAEAFVHRLDRWAAAPHKTLPAATNGVNLRLFDDAPTSDHHLHLFRDQQPVLRLPRQEWNPPSGTLFAPHIQPYQPLPAELEPPSQYGTFVETPDYYEPGCCNHGGVFQDDESFDIAALADQYLDLSEHCPVPAMTRSVSPSETDISDVPEVDRRAAKRRRIADWDFLRASPSDDGWSDGTSITGGEPTGPSPFLHSPPPAHKPHVASETRVRHTAGRKPTQQGPPPLKFTEAHKDGRSKRQKLACLFCRSRKIACSGPPDDSSDTKCNQCTRRGRSCEYPKESRRGQHSRIKSLARRAQIAQNLTLEILLP
ncbi:hypothetical protein B0H16DRAFT_1551405 [Mycena metata]|uniref:Zn(2)-C6 fungal-type domain-containing protein n=1 Tax=Mycena metata TaxID=1033252 RepID=A0AAD7IU28_9AGAR|nr:hypothetical protein B0H16DRAFT_1551405 [Mycena metata]